MINIPIIWIYYEFFKFFLTKRNKSLVIFVFIILPLILTYFSSKIIIGNKYLVDIFLKFISVNNFSNLIWLFSVLVAISAIIYPFLSSGYFQEYIEKNKLNKERVELFIKSLKLQLFVILMTVVLVSILVFLVFMKDIEYVKYILLFFNIFIWINFIFLIHDTSYLVIEYKK